ncbi:hypothetical protein K438DRAFT_1902046 [Mycena galopus ATCC 62051]|nr:hypothetical protein K438DRAFT_1902046 [Mycena galopus ATCC 62051]
MTALLDPVLDQFQEMWRGKMVPTYNHPEGDFYRAAIIAAIGDLLALKKALGCVGHMSHNFCSFCKLQRCDIDRLDHTNFELRRGVEVLQAAKAWLVAQTQKACKSIFAQHGSRRSPFHAITYRDPVKHTVLGPMHGWIEGILQHHCHLKWGIGSDFSTARSTGAGAFDTPSSSDSDVEMMDLDDNTIATEIEDLHEDSFIQNDAPASFLRCASFIFMPESDDKIIQDKKPSRRVFESDSMAIIHAGLAGVVIPAWIDRPPVNLGEKAHGKLKADNWFVLFTIFFPLIIPELWHHPSSPRRDNKLLDNFHNLIGATNILCSYTTSPAEADDYVNMYLDYLQSSKSLFPDLTTHPNHHYAIHNRDQMKWWGPLIKLSEFMYESHNRSLQKIKTNNHMWELDLTMLHQICRRWRLLASISDSAQKTDSKSPVGEAMRVLSPRDPVSANSQSLQQLSPAEETAFNSSGVVLDVRIYELILGYWNHTHSPPYIRSAELTYDLVDAGVNVFPNRGVQLTNLMHKTRLFSTFKQHHGNSSISFRHPLTGWKGMGYIRSIWVQALQGRRRTFVVVQPHTDLIPTDAAKTPYPTHPRFKCTVGYSEPLFPQPQLIVEPRRIISHVEYHQRPKGTFGIKQAITIFVDSLHRNRD